MEEATHRPVGPLASPLHLSQAQIPGPQRLQMAFPRRHLDGFRPRASSRRLASLPDRRDLHLRASKIRRGLRGWGSRSHAVPRQAVLEETGTVARIGTAMAVAETIMEEEGTAIKAMVVGAVDTKGAMRIVIDRREMTVVVDGVVEEDITVAEDMVEVDTAEAGTMEGGRRAVAERC